MENEAHKSKGNKKIKRKMVKRKKNIARRSNTCPFGDLEGAAS